MNRETMNREMNMKTTTNRSISQPITRSAAIMQSAVASPIRFGVNAAMWATVFAATVLMMPTHANAQIVPGQDVPGHDVLGHNVAGQDAFGFRSTGSPRIPTLPAPRRSGSSIDRSIVSGASFRNESPRDDANARNRRVPAQSVSFRGGAVHGNAGCDAACCDSGAFGCNGACGSGCGGGAGGGGNACQVCRTYNSPAGLPFCDRDGLTDEQECARTLGIGPLGFGPMDDATESHWQNPYCPPFDLFGPGEYAGPARARRLPQYRLRPGDTVQFIYIVTELRSQDTYRLVVGDELVIESEADEALARGDLENGLRVQPDGTIYLRFIGRVQAAGRTIADLREELEQRYTEFYPEPSIDVTPVNTGSAAIAVRNAISGAGGFDPQITQQTVTPSGEIRLPKIGQVYAQGLTLDELKREINLRYDSVVGGLEVEPSLQSQAPHNIFVVGEVRTPGRFELDDTPTTVTGAVALAGGYVPGANLRQIVIFRRDQNWRLLSTMVDLRAAFLGRQSHPIDDVFIRDGDVIIVPSTPIRLFDNFVRQVFTEGIYGIFPLTASYNFGQSFD